MVKHILCYVFNLPVAFTLTYYINLLYYQVELILLTTEQIPTH